MQIRDVRKEANVKGFCSDLHGLVVPAVAPILGWTSSMEHQHGPCGITEISPRGIIQTHQAQTTLDHVQRVPVCGF